MLLTNTKRKTADREAAEAAAIAEQLFKDQRAAAIEAAVVCINGNNYNANERSIARMAETVAAASDEPDSLALGWSMADTPSGVLTPITLGELRQALKAAVINRGALWGRND